MNQVMYELVPRHTSQKSFYGKAMVVIDGNQSKLYSYGTHVATLTPGLTSTEDAAEVYGTHSATTLKHIKEFLKQNGLPAHTKAFIEDRYM